MSAGKKVAEATILTQADLQKAFTVGLLSIDRSLPSNAIKVILDKKLGQPYAKRQQIAAYKAWATIETRKNKKA